MRNGKADQLEDAKNSSNGFLVFKPEFSRRLSRIFFSAGSRLSRNFRGRLSTNRGRLSRRLRGLVSSHLVILKSDQLTPPQPFESTVTAVYMAMTVHVSQLVRGCFYQLRRIKTIRKFIPTSAAVILVNNFIVSRVDYCSSILAGLQTCRLDWIQSVLCSAARFVYIIMVGHHPIIQPTCCLATYIG